MVTVRTYPDLEALIDASATAFTELIGAIHRDPSGGVNRDGTARVVLTGGTAGIRLLRALRGAEVDWGRVLVFFGDERNVPLSDPESNEGQAREALLDHVAIPEDNVVGYGLNGGEMGAAVDHYEEAVAARAPEGFDLHLLGMGGEGHVNSLFPGSEAVRESQRLVVAVTDSPKPPAQRATLTLPAVHRAERVWLLVSGAEKAEAADHVARGSHPDQWPAAGARGCVETVLHVTEDATSRS